MIAKKLVFNVASARLTARESSSIQLNLAVWLTPSRRVKVHSRSTHAHAHFAGDLVEPLHILRDVQNIYTARASDKVTVQRHGHDDAQVAGLQSRHFPANACHQLW